ncbi:hypothetical protein HPB48_007393 [Haemaphysalis longicornis]|uniref:PiggyBac transposable element-derived protein domain-containing protein n=1 Tax=Haemaphysalis longicornis TaxID=44386 RepID=A0A9J6FVV4_HAELO|nr:hypothetical protein HPB48_007393 [Haemaphysalis longicornis]
MHCWRQLDLEVIKDSMQRARFFELRSYLHLVDRICVTDKEKDANRLFVKPVVEFFRKACLEIPRSREVLRGRANGTVNWRVPHAAVCPEQTEPCCAEEVCVAASYGLVLDFAIHVGKGTAPNSELKKLGLGGAVGKKLTETVNRHDVTFLFTDRYFMGINVAALFAHENVNISGTIMANRTNGDATRMPNERAMKRGESYCIVRRDDKLCLGKWKDNKSIISLSTAFATDLEWKWRRWSKKVKKRIELIQPHIVAQYN